MPRAWPDLEKVDTDPADGSPRLGRTLKQNEILEILSKEIFKLDVTLVDGSDNPVSLQLLSLTESKLALFGGGGGAAEAAPFPFQVTVTPQAGPSTDADVTVYPGSFDNFIASNFDSTFVVPQTGDRYLVATLTFAAGEITAAIYSIETTPPVTPAAAKDAPPTSLAILLAIISGAVAFNIENSSLSLAAQLKFQVEKGVTVGPGESPFEYYYAWGWA